jgi:hypothetical protein
LEAMYVFVPVKLILVQSFVISALIPNFPALLSLSFQHLKAIDTRGTPSSPMF